MSGETETNVSGWTTDTVHSQIMTLLAERDQRHELALESLREALSARLNAIDKATDKFEANIERVPTDVDKQVGHLKELHDEKFASVAQQFKERDTRSERESRDNKVAVDAAFAAQKEAASEQNKSNTLAIDKSEKATAETLNKQADLFKSTTDALDDKISSNKDTMNKMDGRLTTIESRGVVVRESQGQSNWAIGLTAVVLIAGINVLLHFIK